ncbi:MAG: hypothetical protein ACRD3L_10330 [Terriglobales bacterium]
MKTPFRWVPATANGKVSANPAKLVKTRRENNAPERYLTDAEELVLRKKISHGGPEHLPGFDIVETEDFSAARLNPGASTSRDPWRTIDEIKRDIVQALESPALSAVARQECVRTLSPWF